MKPLFKYRIPRWLAAVLLSLTAVTMAQVPAGTQIANTASVICQDPGGNLYSDTSNTVITEVAPIIRMTLTKSVDAVVGLPGDTVQFTITAQNTGNVDIVSFMLRDTLPSAFHFVSASHGGTITGKSVAWDLTGLPWGQSTAVTLNCRIDNTVFTGQEIGNQAWFTGPVGISGPSNAVLLTVGRYPAMEFSKTVDRAIAASEDTLTYTLSARNIGNAPSTNTLIHDDIPDFTSFVSASNNPEFNAGIISWNEKTILPGEEISETLRVKLHQNVALNTQILNVAQLTNAEGVSNVEKALTQIGLPDNPLSISKSTMQSVYTTVDTITYQLVIVNRAGNAVSDVTVSDNLPSGLTFLSASHGGILENGVVRWTFSQVAASAADTLIMRVLPLPGENPVVVTNTVWVVSGDDGTATASCEIVINPPPNPLTLMKDPGQSAYLPRDTVTYSLIVRNTASFPVQNVVVVDTLPDSLSFISASHGGIHEAGVITWNLEILAAQEADSLVLMAAADSSILATTSILNKATARSDYGGFATDQTTVQVNALPLLTAEKSAPSGIMPWDTLGYTVMVTNGGPGIATQLTARDTLPDLLEFLTATPGYSYDDGSRSLTWNLGTLGPDSSRILEVFARVSQPQAVNSNVINRLNVTCGEGFQASDTAGTHIHPFQINVSADPEILIGNGRDTSLVTAVVTDFYGLPAVDSMPVIFSTTAGFWVGNDTAYLENGTATIALVSAQIKGSDLTAIIEAVAGDPRIGFVSDTTLVHFLSGGLYGAVHTPDGDPVEQVSLQVTRVSTGTVTGTDTTGIDGQYYVGISYSDDYRTEGWMMEGDHAQKVIDHIIHVDIPATGDIEPVPNLNSVYGRLIDSRSLEHLNYEKLEVVLWSDSSTGRSLPIDTVYSDTGGTYLFSGLTPGMYIVRVETEGIDSYKDGALNLELPAPGYHLVDANIPLTQSLFSAFKTVDKTRASPGDTLIYSIIYSSHKSAVDDTIHIIDQVPEGLEILSASFELSTSVIATGFDPLTRTLRFHRAGMGVGETDTIRFQAHISTAIDPGLLSMTNTALVFSGNDSSATVDDVRSHARTQLLVPFLKVDKSVYPKTAEPGDVLTYSVTVKNTSATTRLWAVELQDILPPGFKYSRKTTIWQSERKQEPVISHTDSRMTMTWAFPDTLEPQQSAVLKYRAHIGLNSRIGDNENLVVSSAITHDQLAISAPPARAAVAVRPGILSDRGLIIGKVYFDLNENGIQDYSEPTMPGVELITETGIRVTTDESGKYSIPNVTPGDHVIRINRRTLPEGTELLLNSVDFLGDPRSRLVRVPHGGISRANFILRGRYYPRLAIEDRTVDSATVTCQRQFMSEDFRLLVFKPWKVDMRVQFESKTATLLPEALAVMKRIGDFMTWQNGITLDMTGHTDNRALPGDSDVKDNQRLSELRAATIKRVLVEEYGIDSSRITTRGMGDRQPIADNAIVEGRNLNRRVELVFNPPKETTLVDSTLLMKARFRYSGGMQLPATRYTASIPAGFKYNPGSTLFADNQVEPEISDKQTVTWDLGAWWQPQDKEISYRISVGDYHEIKSVSKTLSWLTVETAADSTVTLDTLMADIRSQVDEVLFRIVMSGAQFQSGSAVLQPSARTSLEALGEFLTWRGEIRIKVYGFTDNQGPLDRNMMLSEARAQSVKDYLVRNYTIDPGRIQIHGYGPQFAVVDNNTGTGRTLNRRVEVLAVTDYQQEIVLNYSAIRDSVSRKFRLSRNAEPGDAPDSLFYFPAGSTNLLHLSIDASELVHADRVSLSVELPDQWELVNTVDGSRYAQRAELSIPLGPGKRTAGQSVKILVPLNTVREVRLRLRLQAYLKAKQHGHPTIEEFRIITR